MRLAWMLMYEQIKNASFLTRHFGISKKTFYKWRKRYLTANKNPDTLIDRSKKPNCSPLLTKKEITQIIKKLRKKTCFGEDRLRLFLLKDYNLDIPRSTIYYILKRERLIKKNKRHKKKPLIYNLSYSGNNIQVDIKIIGSYSTRRIIQYSAQDDATRIKFTRLYPERANYYSV
ncbi:MAG: helix-turn-helix domain-containing protein [Candidatus Omnitrophica bacterium]|nr:helix-turn-helix domain-containing protein [Candidatus Omnitrophota bacterium]